MASHNVDFYVMAISNAVAQNRISTTVGYNLAAGNANVDNENLPHYTAILAEANTANQSGLSLTPTEITSAYQAGTAYGFGSPIHIAARILFPQNGGGTNAKVVAYPQAAAGGSAARAQTITVTGTATGNGTHYVVVAGRNNIDGIFYSVNIVSGDTPTMIGNKIRDAVNGVTASPLSATAATGVTTATVKWTGLTSEAVTLTMDSTLAANIGVTYVIAETVAGSGTPDVAAALALFSNTWVTEVINGYGTVTATMTALEAFNGVPGVTGSTGRYAGITFKPFIALTGSVADDPSSITNARATQVTIAICPAPLSPGLPIEAAANMAVLFSNVCINTPNLDVMEMPYPDMPVPALTSIPAMQDYNFRDSIVKLGCSTVAIENLVYTVKDFVTTFNDGTANPQYRWCRNLNIDWNIQYGYKLMQLANVLGFTIINDNDTVNATNTIRPKQLRALIGDYFDQLVLRALVADTAFTKAGLQVGINSTNPDRIDAAFPYKRTGIGRILATTAFGNFNFGNVG